MQKLLLPIALLIGFTLQAQRLCNSTEAQKEWFAKHPDLKMIFDKHQQDASLLDQQMAGNGYSLQKSASAPNYTIPIVFHILHLGGGENISDAQVNDAVSILTRDFNALNSDTSDVVVQFKSNIGNPKFDFVLAKKDPNGNCTNGIIRHYDANTDWDGNLPDYAYTWPPTRYLNIYVVRTMGSGAAGYTYLPGSGIPAAMDAIVMLSGYVGSLGSGNGYTSRTLTHEVGHWLDLPHVWGYNNQPGQVCGDEGVNDTPVTKGFSSCNLSNSSVCNQGVTENVQNYMDYSYCSRMFTNGQAARMTNCISSTLNGRNNLHTSGNLALTGITAPGANCIPMMDIAALPGQTICSGKPLSLKSFTSNSTVTGFTWSATGSAVIQSPSSANTSIVFNSPGQSIVTCIASGANGSITRTLNIEVKNGLPQIALSNVESFESSSAVPPALWPVLNPDTPNEKWEVTSMGASNGIVSLYVPGENMEPNSLEILQSPSYDFKHNQGAHLSFKYAYAWHSAANKDQFKVLASKDCGGTWESVWSPGNAYLSFDSGEIDSTLFFPAPFQWKTYEITSGPYFYPFKNEEAVIFRFSFQEDINGVGHGNRFYLDEVNFSTPVGMNELSRSVEFDLYPNPTNSEFNLHFNLHDASTVSYQVTSLTGALMANGPERLLPAGPHDLRVNESAGLSTGIYFVHFNLNGTNITRKLIIN